MSRKNKVDIPDDLKTKCNVIIHGASTASAAACAGIAQIPLADNAVLAPIQIGWMAVDHFAKGYQLDQFEYEETSDRKREAEQKKTADEEELDIDLWKKDFEKRARAALEKNDPAELDALVSEFEKMEQKLPEDDPLRELYDKLLEARC